MEPRFSLTLGTWAIAQAEKKFGPCLRVRPSNPVSESYIWWEISAHESLWNASKPCFPKINENRFQRYERYASTISVP